MILDIRPFHRLGCTVNACMPPLEEHPWLLEQGINMQLLSSMEPLPERLKTRSDLLDTTTPLEFVPMQKETERIHELCPHRNVEERGLIPQLLKRSFTDKAIKQFHVEIGEHCYVSDRYTPRPTSV